MPEILTCGEQTRESIIARAMRELARGELVIIPTETVYGLAADARREGAIERIYQAKSRDRGKPVALLASGIEAIEQLDVSLSRTEALLAEAFWPGPLTLLLQDRNGREEGFRVPDSALILDLLRAAGGVLRVTSANRSGEPDARTAEEAMVHLARHVAIVIDSGPVTGGTPSSVVRIRDGAVEMLREGALKEADILAVVEGID